MAFVNLNSIKDELMNFLRNSNIISTTNRGVTTVSDSFTATAGQTVFTLTNATVKNVRAVTVNAVVKTYITDYTIDFDAHTVTLLVASTVSDAIIIQYDYGTTDKIFPDYPQKQIKMNSMPRIAFDIINGDSNLNSIGEVTVTSRLLVSANVYDANYKSIDNIMYALRNALNNNAKAFKTFNFIKPRGLYPLLPTPFGEDKIMQKTADFEILIINEG